MQTDIMLLDSVRRMDEETLTEIFDEYAPALYKYVMRMSNDARVADQIVGDVFAKLLDQLSLGNGPHTNLRGYLFQAAHHLLISQVRDANRRMPLEQFDFDPPPELMIDPRLEQHLLYEAVLLAIVDQLTEYQQQVIILRFLEGYSLRETAEILGKTVNIVKAAQNRAITALRTVLHSWEAI